MRWFISKLILTPLFFVYTFPLFAHVVIDYPKGGETFSGGSVITIRWHISIQHVTLNWDLNYSSDGGMSWEPIYIDLPPGQLSYDWLVPGTSTSLARVSVIQDNDGQDYQDESGNFTIVGTSSTDHPAAPDMIIQLFPNPVHDVLNIDFGQDESRNINLIISDACGITRWIYRGKAQKLFVPVQDYASGIYFLQVQATGYRNIRKVIVL